MTCRTDDPVNALLILLSEFCVNGVVRANEEDKAVFVVIVLSILVCTMSERASCCLHVVQVALAPNHS